MAMQGRTQSRFAQCAAWLLLQTGLTAASVLFLGGAGLVAVCLAAWPLAAWINARQGWTGYALPLMIGGSAMMLLSDKLALPLAVWCLAALIALLLTGRQLPVFRDKPRWFREGSIHGGLALAAVVAVILCLQGSYPGGIAQGMATDMVSVIKDAPNGAQMLYSLYESGLVPLDKTMTAVTEGTDGMLYMSAEVRDQLLYGLQARLDEAFQLAIPSCVVYLVVLTALLATMLPVTARRRMGVKDDTPRYDRWRLSREVGMPIACLFIGSALPLLTSAPALVAMGQLMTAVASVVFCVMGGSVLRYASRLAGRRPGMTWLMILLAALAVPQLLMLLGVLDQWKDIRKLSKNNETEEDRV